MAMRAHTTPSAGGKTHRRGILLGAALLPVSAKVATPNPDAELIVAFNTGNSDGSDSDPLWIAYATSRDAIHDAQPQTLAGMRAKALVAKTEALRPDGTEDPDGTVAPHWAWDLVNDLLRLTGGAA